MLNSVRQLSFLALVFCDLLAASRASELREGELQSDLVPSPVKYSVVLPEGYETGEEAYPLLLILHGGGGDHNELTTWQAVLDELWKEQAIPQMVVVMPSAKNSVLGGRGLYMDFRDSSEKWESFLVHEFLDHIRQEYRAARRREGTLIAGMSMGGLVALRIGLKYPEKFAGLAAFEPAIMPALAWQDVAPRNRFFRSDEMLGQIHGKPLDESHWAANNPATIVKRNAASIRGSGLDIYLECGDQDYLNLHEGTEFLHQVLWNCDIPHEYHLVRGADHLGRTLQQRRLEGLKFLDRVLNPPEPDPAVERLERMFPGEKEEGERKSPRRFRSQHQLN